MKDVVISIKNCDNVVIKRFLLKKVLSSLLKNKNVYMINEFINKYYNLEKALPNDIYDLILNTQNINLLAKVMASKNIYELISFLKYNNEETCHLAEEISIYDYINVPRKFLNNIIKKLKDIPFTSERNQDLQKDIKWSLRKRPMQSDSEYLLIAYKMYLTVGLDNTLEILQGYYGKIDYELIYYLFSSLNLNTKLSEEKNTIFCKILFGNKKEFSNYLRQIISGHFNEMLLNFDYFYNEFSYFLDKLGTKMSKEKMQVLMQERYIPRNFIGSYISGDILKDMVHSYKHKYEYDSFSDKKIIEENTNIYTQYLINKTQCSIPNISLGSENEYTGEVLKLNDSKNLVMGYRAGNCFRINGEAATLFHQFLKSEHMRIISISTKEYKDFAMMLVMRNGNVLIAQGIETSKYVPDALKGQKLYNYCEYILKSLMEYMNDCGDEIVATIIGCTNENVYSYNKQFLPFLVSPILENGANYYNGVDNLQCLIGFYNEKSLKNIKLFVPEVRYKDERLPVLSRSNDAEFNKDYDKIEKILMSLRYQRFLETKKIEFYQNLINKREEILYCNVDWYLIKFHDGTIDGYIYGNDTRSQDEYNEHMKLLKTKNNKRTKI